MSFRTRIRIPEPQEPIRAFERPLPHPSLPEILLLCVALMAAIGMALFGILQHASLT